MNIHVVQIEKERCTLRRLELFTRDPMNCLRVLLLELSEHVEAPCQLMAGNRDPRVRHDGHSAIARMGEGLGQGDHTRAQRRPGLLGDPRLQAVGRRVAARQDGGDGGQGSTEPARRSGERRATRRRTPTAPGPSAAKYPVEIQVIRTKRVDDEQDDIPAARTLPR